MFLWIQNQVDVKKRTRAECDTQDELFGYEDFKEGEERLGWMVTYAQVYQTKFNSHYQIISVCISSSAYVFVRVTVMACTPKSS